MSLSSHFPRVRHRSRSMAKWKHKRWASTVKRIESKRKKRSRTKDVRHRNSCFHSQTAVTLPLYSCCWWCCIRSCKNSLGFLFEFYDLNRILRNIFPPLPRSGRRNRVSSWFYALFLWLYVCTPLHLPSGFFVVAVAICNG